jgi:sigma-B regulation protein RsbU (phosphoserine phosphatase)
LTELKKRRDELELTVQERTEAQQQLEKTLIIQKAILDNIADMAWLKDREGRFLAVNAAFESASGINRDQLVGRTDFDFWPQELAQRFRADDEEVMKSCEPKRIEETRARETSKPTWIETIKSPICDADGTVIGITGISRNITKYVEEIAETTAAKERIETELFIASEIQKRMLPPEEPEFALEKESQLCAKYRPAREVGGDLCDYFLAGDHNLCFLVGDVSEKGVAAALFMALTIALIRISAKQGYLPDQVLRMVNAELAQGSTMCMFVTLFIGSIDLRTGELVYSNAGHNPPYLLPATGGCRELKIPRGKPLGLPGKAEFQLAKTTLTPGDGLFLFTDGITEAVDVSGELFSEIRLEDILDRMPGLRAKEIVDGVFRRLEDFSEGVAQADDITALCVRFRSSVQPSERTSVTLTGDLSQIYVAGEALERFARDHSIAEDVLGDMWLALEEVVVNIINHGIESPSGRIEVLFEIDRTTLTITVIDDCRPFNPLDVEPFEKDKYWNEKLIGGLGLHLVRNLTDSLEYHRKDDKNVLILKKGLAQNIPTP